MRVAYLGPAGTVQRTRRCSPAPGARLRAGAARRRCTTRCWPCTRARRARARADRELARGLGQRDARRARVRDRRRRDRRRARPPGPPLPDRARAGRARARSRAVASHPQASGQCAALPARRGCRGAAVVPAASTADAVRLVAERERRRAVRRRSAAAPAAELYGCDGARLEASRTRRARRRASCGSRREAPDPERGRRVEDRADVLGAERRPAGLARASNTWPCPAG